MYRWGIRSCMLSSSCFNFRFNLKYIQLNSTFRIIKAYQKSSDFVSQRSLSSSEQLYVYYFHILHFWGFIYYPRAWSNSKNNRNQHAFHLPFFIQAFCIKTCFSNKPVLLFNLPCVLLGSWNFNFFIFYWLWKERSFGLGSHSCYCLSKKFCRTEVVYMDLFSSWSKQQEGHSINERSPLCLVLFLGDCCTLWTTVLTTCFTHSNKHLSPTLLLIKCCMLQGSSEWQWPGRQLYINATKHCPPIPNYSSYIK